MEKFLSLDTMITPKIITFVYQISLVIIVMLGVAMMFNGVFGILYGIFIIVVGSLSSRLSCEFIIVIFNIHENTKRIADKA